MGDTPYEIERKFVIEEIDVELLDAAATSVSHIEQTYLLNPDGDAERVRHRRILDRAGDRLQLTHTRKRAVSAGVAEEYERELTEQEYAEQLRRTDPRRVPVVKTRWVVPHGDIALEIDRFESPRRLWLLEVELTHGDDLRAQLELPAWVTVVEEVTGDPAYANWQLALPPT